MTRYETACQNARRLFAQCYDGVLSTLSTDLPGYPFGSVLPFCCNREGQPIFMAADIAQHTGNLRLDPRASLIVFDRAVADLQTHGRITLLGTATEVVDQDAGITSRYYNYFPRAREFRATHNFRFWRLVPERIRFIGGFGEIHWLEPLDLIEANPFSEIDEQRIIEHMNHDHADAMRRYLDLDESTDPIMAGIDARGIHLRLGPRICRVHFAGRVDSTEAARVELVRLAHDAKTATA